MLARDLVYVWEPDHLHSQYGTPHVVKLLPTGENTLCGMILVATDLVNTQTSGWLTSTAIPSAGRCTCAAEDSAASLGSA